MKTKRYTGEEDGSFVEAGSGTSESTVEPEKKAKASPRIVTKEELAKSGYSNLRDFLNAERGLKRRDGSAPERTASAGAGRDYGGSSGSGEYAPAKPAKAPETTARAGRASQATVNTARPQPTEEGIAAANERRAKMREEMSDTPIARMFKAIRARGEATQNYAKGGKVSSASKRADGIAQKGKTRGKMC